MHYGQTIMHLRDAGNNPITRNAAERWLETHQPQAQTPQA